MHIVFEGWFKGRFEGGIKQVLKAFQTNNVNVELETRH